MLYYLKQTMHTSSCFRGFVYFVFGVSAAPLGLFIAFALACGTVLASILFPILFGPICFSLYVTFLAYVMWRFVRVFFEIVNSLETSIKQSFKRCMGWLYKNTQRLPFSKSSELSLPEPLGAEDSDQDDENVQASLSDEDLHEQSAHADFRQFNVRSVSGNATILTIYTSFLRQIRFFQVPVGLL